MKGLLFTPEMARAVMREESPKTQTRRVVPGLIRPCRIGEDVYYELLAKSASPHPRSLPEDWCQYTPGDKVCLLTTWAVALQFDNKRPKEISPRTTAIRFWHAGMGTPKPEWAGKSRPGRFLPNKLRHLMPELLIDDVDVQRVQQINETDAVAEGVTTESYLVETATSSARIMLPSGGRVPVVGDELTKLGKLLAVTPLGAEKAFRALWDSINKKRGKGWTRNPQVFVIKFTRLPITDGGAS